MLVDPRKHFVWSLDVSSSFFEARSIFTGFVQKRIFFGKKIDSRPIATSLLGSKLYVLCINNLVSVSIWTHKTRSYGLRVANYNAIVPTESTLIILGKYESLSFDPAKKLATKIALNTEDSEFVAATYTKGVVYIIARKSETHLLKQYFIVKNSAQSTEISLPFWFSSPVLAPGKGKIFVFGGRGEGKYQFRNSFSIGIKSLDTQEGPLLPVGASMKLSTVAKTKDLLGFCTNDKDLIVFNTKTSTFKRLSEKLADKRVGFLWCYQISLKSYCRIKLDLLSKSVIKEIALLIS